MFFHLRFHEIDAWDHGSDQPKLMRIDEWHKTNFVFNKNKNSTWTLDWRVLKILWVALVLWLFAVIEQQFLLVWFACSWSFSTVIDRHWEAKLCCDWSSHTGATSPSDPPNGPYRCFWFGFVFWIPVRMNLWTVHIGV